MTKLTSLLLPFCLLAGGCASLSRNSVDITPQASLLASCHIPIGQQIDALAQPLVARGRTPGMVVALLQAGGQRQIFSYGFTDSDRRIPVTGDTLFAVGSITKGFTAESAALLVDEGKLRWNTTLGELADNPQALSADARQITLEQLATHTAGLPRQIPSLHMLRGLMTYLFTGAPFYDELDRGDFRDYLRDFQRPAPRRVVYSNLGYSILDYVITTGAQASPQQIATQRIIAPLGMHHTGYQPSALPGYMLRARGHAGDQPTFVRRGETVPDWQFSGYMVGAASLWSSASDLLRYLDAHLNGSGRSDLDRAFAEAIAPRFRAPERDSAGLAWLVNEVNGQKIVYQSGFIGGYASYIGMDVKHKTAIVVLQNSFNWDNAVGHRMLLRMAAASEHRCESATPPATR
ncbi:serine hydrolase domain-containing protein [Erwinia oleae]|uniref:serine hydrolase domain-containing protein n=1 Tax=Erwinia oleae TaxID=796334 RepID=UPI00068D68D9|nr:serine hydrolase domain-containing protein [Erwinia oleae]